MTTRDRVRVETSGPDDQAGLQRLAGLVPVAGRRGSRASSRRPASTSSSSGSRATWTRSTRSPPAARRQQPDAERHAGVGGRGLRPADRPGQRQLDRQRPDHRRAGHQLSRGPARARRSASKPAWSTTSCWRSVCRRPALSLDDVEIVNLETGAAAASFAAGQLDAVGVFAPFTTQALKRSGSKMLFSSKDFPGAIPDHLVVSGELVDRAARRRAEAGQRLVHDAGLHQGEPGQVDRDHGQARRCHVCRVQGVRRGHDAVHATTQNIKAFSDGNDITHLDFAAKEIAAFMLDNGFIEKPFDYSKRVRVPSSSRPTQQRSRSEAR